jgi:tRNA(fMet)-specific endonuclease VapC
VLILDTDHIVELQKEDVARRERLRLRLRASREQVAVTIISAEEQMRGWLSSIHRIRDPFRQVRPYSQLLELFSFYAEWELLPFDALAADAYAALRKSGIRVGTMDLKIAGIAKIVGAKLLSRNMVDFGRVPGLAVEDWLS